MKRRLIIILLILVTIILFGLCYTNSRLDGIKSTAGKSVTVKTEIAHLEEISQNIFAIGTVVSNQEVSLTTPVSKKVTKILFSDGQFVEKGDLIVQLDDSQEQAEKKNLEATYAEQKREFDRLEPLRKARVISEKDYEMQRTKMITAQASLDLINAKINELRIEAPFGGKLGLKNVSVGALIPVGTEVTTLDDIREVKVDFYVPEKYISKLHVGDSVIATSDSYKNINFNGSILAISTRIDKDSRMLAVRGIFNNEKLMLRSGMSLKLNVKFNKRFSICIPEKSVVSVGDKKYIYVVEDNKAKKVEVQTGKREGGKIEIVNGLNSGDIFISDGIINVKDGVSLNILNKL